MASASLPFAALGVDDEDEGGAPTDYPYCLARPGLEPHEYQPLVDLFGGTGIWLFCSQCGDHFNIDGTAPGTPAAAPPPPQPGSTSVPTPVPPWKP